MSVAHFVGWMNKIGLTWGSGFAFTPGFILTPAPPARRLKLFSAQKFG